jgi:hypothetical protein
LPSRSLTGPRTERSLGEEGEIRLPPGFDVKREQGEHGLVEIKKVRDSLDQAEYRVEPIERGVKVIWRLKNPNAIKRTGALTVELKGIANTNPGFTAKYTAFRKRLLETF